MNAPANHHAAVWVDHHDANIFFIEPFAFNEANLHAPGHHVRRHPDRNASEHTHPDDLKHFFHDIAKVLESADEVLVLGPSTAKLHFFRYVHAHHPWLEQRIVGVETVDHPSDGQLVAFARRYFHKTDRMRGNVA